MDRKLNIDDLKEMVENCVYEEENLVCMNSEHYRKMINTMSNFQTRLDKIKDYLKQVHFETQHGILSSNYLIWTNIERLCDGLDILERKTD